MIYTMVLFLMTLSDAYLDFKVDALGVLCAIAKFLFSITPDC